MKIAQYKGIVTHDAGKETITIWAATSREAAIAIIMQVRNCPRSSIKRCWKSKDLF